MSGHTIRSGLGTYGRTPRDLLRDPTISPTAKTLFGILEDYATPDSPKPFPSISTQAGYLGISESTVRRHLAELRDAGWIAVEACYVNEAGERVSDPGDGNRQTSNAYELCPVTSDSPPVTSGRGGVSPVEGGPLSPVTPEEEPVEAEPLKQPASHENDSQTPARTGGGGEVEEVEETGIIRQTAASVCWTAGITDSDTRDGVSTLVADYLGPKAVHPMAPQTVHDVATAGSFDGVRNPVAVMRHRLEQHTKPKGTKKPKLEVVK